MMTRLWIPALFALLFATAAARAQSGHLVTSDQALDKEVCTQIVKRLMPRIEAYTRLKFRRRIPVRVEPKAVWQARAKQEGFAGFAGRYGLAYYSPGINQVTIVPWTMGYNYRNGEVTRRRSKEEWLAEVEPTLIHELTHGIHHQNFFIEMRNRGASLRRDGLSEHQLDRSTVDFLLSEGLAELVSLRVTDFVSRMDRHPNRELSHGRFYMGRYRPNGKDPYRVLLSNHGYQDGLDLLHHLTFAAGPRGVRAVLYRPPPRQLFFQPKILAEVELDDPPEPDSILHELYPAPTMAGVEIHMAANPGSGRYFEGAYRVRTRAPGCLVGYVAKTEDEEGASYRYAMFVSNPDDRGTWSQEQAEGLKALGSGGASEKRVPLPLTKGVQATVLTVEDGSGGRYVRAECDGLVVLAHESQPTQRLEERVMAALRVLYIKRPTPNIYAKALEKAKAELARTD
jgi:hypothetical protein